MRTDLAILVVATARSKRSDESSRAAWPECWNAQRSGQQTTIGERSLSGTRWILTLAAALLVLTFALTF